MNKLTAYVFLFGVKLKGSTCIKSFYISEEVVAHIPSYAAQLREQLASIQGDDEPIIRDNIPRDPLAVSRAIRDLVTGYLTSLENVSSRVGTNTLHRLVDLYDFSIAMSIKCLELAVLSRIDFVNFVALNHDILLTLARRYSSETGPGT
jgi:hypothetical protein